MAVVIVVVMKKSAVMTRMTMISIQNVCANKSKNS